MIWVGIVLVLVGIGLRIWAGPKYLDAFARKYSRAPSRGWLWTSDPDPEVERLRRLSVIGSVVLISGAIAELLSLR